MRHRRETARQMVMIEPKYRINEKTASKDKSEDKEKEILRILKQSMHWSVFINAKQSPFSQSQHCCYYIVGPCKHRARAPNVPAATTEAHGLIRRVLALL
jgi:hypothetical protein